MSKTLKILIAIFAGALVYHLCWLWYQTCIVGNLLVSSPPLVYVLLCAIPAVLVLGFISLTYQLFFKKDA